MKSFKLLFIILLASIVLSAPQSLLLASDSEIVIACIAGIADVKKVSNKDWINAENGMQLQVGDRIQTGVFTDAIISFGKNGYVILESIAQLEIDDVYKSGDKLYTELSLKIGGLIVAVAESDYENEFFVKTPNSSLSLKQGDIKQITSEGAFGGTIKNFDLNALVNKLEANNNAISISPKKSETVANKSGAMLTGKSVDDIVFDFTHRYGAFRSNTSVDMANPFNMKKDAASKESTPSFLNEGGPRAGENVEVAGSPINKPIVLDIPADKNGNIFSIEGVKETGNDNYSEKETAFVKKPGNADKLIKLSMNDTRAALGHGLKIEKHAFASKSMSGKQAPKPKLKPWDDDDEFEENDDDLDEDTEMDDDDLDEDAEMDDDEIAGDTGDDEDDISDDEDEEMNDDDDAEAEMRDDDELEAEMNDGDDDEEVEAEMDDDDEIEMIAMIYQKKKMKALALATINLNNMLKTLTLKLKKTLMASAVKIS